MEVKGLNEQLKTLDGGAVGDNVVIGVKEDVVDGKKIKVAIFDAQLITVKSGIRKALVTQLGKDDPEIDDKKFDLFELAVKIKNSEDSIELESSEITLIQKRVKKVLTIESAGQINRVLNGKPME